MTKTNAINSAHEEPFKKSFRRLAIGLLALTTTTMPFGASATDSKINAERAANLLPLPEIPYLESMQWMRCKPGEPLLKIDTLVVPKPGPAPLLRIPSEYERAFPYPS